MAIMEQIKELRRRTGGGIVECREALLEAGDNIEKAIEVLRKKGIVKVAKKAGRDTREGVIASYVHTNGKIAVLVCVLCETDFVARNDKFKALAHDIALHIAAAEPVVVKPEDVSEDLIAIERNIAVEQAKKGNKPAAIQEKIIQGKLQSFREEKALLSQPFVKDPSITITELINRAVGELGENISVSEFARLSL